MDNPPQREQPPDSVYEDNVEPIAPEITTGSRTISRHSELGNAHRLSDKHGLDLKYDIVAKKWLTWTGKNWAFSDELAGFKYQDMTSDLLDDATGELDQAYVNLETADAQDKRQQAIAKAMVKKAQKYYTHAESSQNMAKQKGTLNVLKSFPDVAIKSRSQFDKHDFLFNCDNGTIDLETGDLKPHDRNDLLTNLCEHKLDMSAKCPTWEWFLKDIFQDDSVIEYLQRFAGYSLTGSTRERCMLVLHGGGKNGKSTFFNTLMRVIGSDYATTTADELLLKKHNDTHPAEVADLFGKRLAVNAEITKHAQFDEGRIKRITGGSDALKARLMGENFFEFLVTFKLIVATNNLPTIKDQTESIWDRIVLIPFKKRVTDGEDIKTLDQDLLAEAEGILAWCVKGCIKWQASGLNESEEMKEAKLSYRDEQDHLGKFLEDCVESSLVENVTVTELFKTYNEWAEKNKESTRGSKRIFGQDIEGKLIPGTNKKMVKKRKSKGTCWEGVGLKIHNRDY